MRLIAPPLLPFVKFLMLIPYIIPHFWGGAFNIGGIYEKKERIEECIIEEDIL